MKSDLHPLRRWRLRNKVTLEQLAKRAKAAGIQVTPSFLSEIENRNKEPSLRMADGLSRVTGRKVRIEAFVGAQGVAA